MVGIAAWAGTSAVDDYEVCISCDFVMEVATADDLCCVSVVGDAAGEEVDSAAAVCVAVASGITEGGWGWAVCEYV